jgi:endonuclease-3
VARGLADLLSDRALHVALVRDALARTYGERAPHQALDPLAELVATILSQHTSDVNSHRAYASLRAAFPTWEEVMTAPTEAIAAAIRGGGLANQKAPRIQQILRDVLAQEGRLSLDNIAAMGLEAAMARLCALHGVGEKTAACVLLFSCGLPAFPVDTHIHRVSRRLGFAPPTATPETVRQIVERVLPPDYTYDLHVNLITHGRRVCRAQVPRCAACTLRHLCVYVHSGARP